ncbi:hypothetical protein RR46_01912 [Papilio xuthus]|uniref:Uncharacterized protein n=1 Tax=Papilio xuthus TaxID=66420 RepID=A0A194QG30_PAPXU|nr:hypothetical protein RR46_01912 [Papilio xuthus]
MSGRETPRAAPRTSHLAPRDTRHVAHMIPRAGLCGDETSELAEPSVSERCGAAAPVCCLLTSARTTTPSSECASPLSTPH